MIRERERELYYAGIRNGKIVVASKIRVWFWSKLDPIRSFLRNKSMKKTS